MSENEQIEKALEKWVKVCPFSRSETAKQEAYVDGYEAGAKEGVVDGLRLVLAMLDEEPKFSDSGIRMVELASIGAKIEELRDKFL